MWLGEPSRLIRIVAPFQHFRHLETNYCDGLVPLHSTLRALVVGRQSWIMLVLLTPEDSRFDNFSAKCFLCDYKLLNGFVVRTILPSRILLVIRFGFV
jgi:hypothetical protein